MLIADPVSGHLKIIITKKEQDTLNTAQPQGDFKDNLVPKIKALSVLTCGTTMRVNIDLLEELHTKCQEIKQLVNVKKKKRSQFVNLFVV